jgi:hypothetical protein
MSNLSDEMQAFCYSQGIGCVLSIQFLSDIRSMPAYGMEADGQFLSDLLAFQTLVDEGQNLFFPSRKKVVIIPFIQWYHLSGDRVYDPRLTDFLSSSIDAKRKPDRLAPRRIRI